VDSKEKDKIARRLLNIKNNGLTVKADLDSVERINGCVGILGMFCEDINADKATFEAMNVKYKDRKLGSWKVTIERTAEAK
jgi:hypothetical protein